MIFMIKTNQGDGVTSISRIDGKQAKEPDAMPMNIDSSNLDILRYIAELVTPLINSLSDIVYFVRPSGEVAYINAAISRFGLEPSEVVGQPFSEFVIIETQNNTLSVFERILHGEPQQFQMVHRDKQGDIRTLRSYGMPVYDQGKVVGVCGVAAEISLSFDYEIILQRRAAQLNLLNALSAKIVSNLELDRMLSSAVRLIQKSFGFFHVAVYLTNAENRQAVLTALAGSLERAIPLNHTVKYGEGMVGSVCLSRKILLANDVLLEPRYINKYPDRVPTKAELSLPIMIADELVGVLDIQSPTVNAFDEHELRTMEAVASQLAVAMKNARLYEEAQLRIRERERAENLMRLQRDLLAELSSTTNLDHALDLILTTLVQIDGVTGGCIFRIEPASGGRRMVAHTGLSDKNLQLFSFFPSTSRHAQEAMFQRPVYASKKQIDLQHDEQAHKALTEEGIVSAAILPVRYHGHTIAHLVAFSQTVTEFSQESKTFLETLAPLVGAGIVRLETEKGLAQSEAKHRALVEAIPDLMFIMDRDGVFIDYKRVPENLLYIPPEQFLGKNLQDTFPPEIARKAAHCLEQAFSTGLPQSLEYDLVLSSSPEPITYEAHYVCADKDRAVVTVRDVSDRKRAEKAKAHILELERTLTNISTRFIAYSDIDAVTDESLRDSGEVLGADASFVYRFHEDSSIAQADFRWTKADSFAEPSPEEGFEVRKSSPWFERLKHNQIIALPGSSPDDDSVQPHLHKRKIKALLIIPLFLQGELTGFLGFSNTSHPHIWSGDEIGFARNIAEIFARAVERHYIAREIDRQMEELEHTNKRLVELDKLKSRFLSGMSNELRTPLHSIIGFSEVLADGKFGDVNATQKEYLADIHSSGRHLLGLIDQMLDFSHLEANRVSLRRSSFSPEALVEESCASLSGEIERSGQRLVVSVAPNLPQLNGDRQRLKQVLVNLLDNAHKFSPASATITLSCQSLFKKSLLFSVADDGPGIPNEQQETIFEQFHRITHTDSQIPGAGLGLAISRRIVEMHSGRIWVESELGSGSTFYVLLPIPS